MKITIQYCSSWGYLPKATSLAAEIEKGLGVKAELVKGGGGIFDVTADGKLVYSKLQTGSFPDNAEVLQSLRALPK